MRGLRTQAFAYLLTMATIPGLLVCATASAQTAPAAGTRQIGTVESIDATALRLKSDKGETITVTLAPDTKVVQLPVGSTDLKAAQPAAVSDLMAGDRVLAIGTPGASSLELSARRLVLMKSTDISRQRESDQAGWQHGSGGVVSAIDAATGAVMLSSGSRTIKIDTSTSTIFKRYAPTSARFEDATRSSLAELHAGDQLRVRGDRETDGSIKAAEIISGSFRHLSGTILAINAASGQVTVQDLKTKKPVTLAITPGTSVHQLPAEMAARFAARARTSSAPATRASTATASARPAPSGSTTAPEPDAASPRSGGDLASVVARLPLSGLESFKVGDAVMAVGTDGAAGSIAALLILGGVEPILAASPAGGAEVALSPWSMGGGEAANTAAQ